MQTELTLNKAYLFGQAVHGLNQIPLRLSAGVIKKLAINMNRINDSFPDVPAAEGEIFGRHGQPKETDEGYKAFLTEKMSYHKTTTIKADLETIKYEELNIGESDRQNHIPPEAVAALSIMIEGFGEAQ